MGIRNPKILSKNEITGYKALANFLNKKLGWIKSDTFERIVLRSLEKSYMSYYIKSTRDIENIYNLQMSDRTLLGVDAKKFSSTSNLIETPAPCVSDSMSINTNTMNEFMQNLQFKKGSGSNKLLDGLSRENFGQRSSKASLDCRKSSTGNKQKRDDSLKYIAKGANAVLEKADYISTK
jgi:hypothetical protein